MLPEINNINELEQSRYDLTYNINIQEEKITGEIIDEMDAIIQACYLILSTERYESPIYNWYYGVELDDLIGKSKEYVNSELKRRIKEALLEDDRIIDVNQFNINYEKDRAIINFTIITNIGNSNLSWEVKI